MHLDHSVITDLKDPCSSQYISVGIVLRPWGLKGWILIHPFNKVEDTILTTCSSWHLRWKTLPINHSPVFSSINIKTSLDVVVEQVKIHGSNSLVALLPGVVTWEEANALKSAEILIARKDFPDMHPESYYWVDLIGCSIMNDAKEYLGKVNKIQSYGAHPVLILDTQSPRGGIRMIPFVDEWIQEVCIQSRLITVHWQLDY